MYHTWRHPESGLSPYLLWPDRAGGHLFSDQGMLQLRAECGAVVPALALRRSPATKIKRGWFSQAYPGAGIGGLWGRVGLAPAEPHRREVPCTQPRRHDRRKPRGAWPARGRKSPEGERKGVRGRAPGDPATRRVGFSLSAPGTGSPTLLLKLDHGAHSPGARPWCWKAKRKHEEKWFDYPRLTFFF